MKNKYLLVIIIGITTMLSACQKENAQNIVPQGAILLSTENFSSLNEDKTSVLNNSVQWVNGDVVKINDNNYTVIVSDGKAYIDPSEHPIDSGEIIACYPTDFYNYTTLFSSSSHRLVFSSDYSCYINSNGHQVIDLPMLAYSNANNEGHPALRFYHATAAVNVKLWNATESALTVTNVKVMTDDYRLNGLVTFDNFSTAPTTSWTPQHGSHPTHRYVLLTFPDHNMEGALVIPADDDTKNVQVPIYPIGADNMTIEVYCTDGTHNYIYSCTNSTPELTRNQMLTARAKLAVGDGNHMTEIL